MTIPNRASDAGPDGAKYCCGCERNKWSSLGECLCCGGELCDLCQSGELNGDRWCQRDECKANMARMVEEAKADALHDNAEALREAARAALGQMLIAGWGVSATKDRRDAYAKLEAVMAEVLKYD